MANSEFTVDIKSFIQDMNKYDAKTQKRFGHTLRAFADIVKTNQFNIIQRLKKKATAGMTPSQLAKLSKGRLQGSLEPTKKNWFTYEIGPRRVVYAWWIEEGDPSTRFSGYHYVRDSLKGIERRITAQLKRDIEQP